MIKEIAFTAYPSKDVAALRKWYEDNLGLEFCCAVRRRRRREVQRGEDRRRLLQPHDPRMDPARSWKRVRRRVRSGRYRKTARDLRGKGIEVEDLYATPVCKITSLRCRRQQGHPASNYGTPLKPNDGRARADVVEHLSARETKSEAPRRLEADGRALRSLLATAGDGAGLHRRRGSRSASCPASSSRTSSTPRSRIRNLRELGDRRRYHSSVGAPGRGDRRPAGLSQLGRRRRHHARHPHQPRRASAPMPLNFFTGTKTGEIMNRVSNDVDNIDNVVTGTLTTIVTNVVVIATTLVAMFVWNWRLGAALGRHRAVDGLPARPGRPADVCTSASRRARSATRSNRSRKRRSRSPASR